MKVKLTSLLVVLIISSLFFFISGKPDIYKSFGSQCQREVDSSNKIECWKDEISKYLEKKPLDKTMDLVSILYSKDPDFAANCHDFTHLIGKKAYELFEKGEDFKISTKASYCGYGFYHGFMENLVIKKGEMEEAREFCEYVDLQVSTETPNAELACYHGIGHGWANVHDESKKGDELAIIYPALELCERVTNDPEKLKLCATGVFDSISFGYYNQINDLKMRVNDPFWICREVKSEHKEACYLDLTPALVWLSDYDLPKSLTYLKNVEVNHRGLVAQNIGENLLRFIIEKKIDFDVAIENCRSLSKTLSQRCINGLASGYFQIGIPKEEYKQSLAFCQRSILTQEEKTLCSKNIIDNLRTWVSKDKYQDICEELENDALDCG